MTAPVGLLVIVVAMVAFWAMVMRPARNQQRTSSSWTTRWRSAGGRALGGDLRAPSIQLTEGQADRGAPGRSLHVANTRCR